MHAGYDGARRSLRPSSRRGVAGGRDSAKAVVINKVRDYTELQREFIISQISLRELYRRHGISAHSHVVTQAKKHKWAEKREQYQTKASESFIEKHAARMADRLAEIEDKAIDVIDQALDKFQSDLKATKPVRYPDGSITEEPVWRMKPKVLAILSDRLMVLFDHPDRVTERHDLSVKSELPIDALNKIAELTRGRAVPPTSPLPRAPRRLDD